MNDSSKPEKKPAESESSASKTEALYDRFVETTNELFERGQEKGQEAWEKAMDITREQMAVAGEFSSEQGEVFKKYMKRDLEHTVTDMRKLGVSAKEHFNPARLGAGALSSLAKLMQTTGDALLALSVRAEEALVYKTGEVTMAGTLTCTKCGTAIQFKKTTVVPECASCQNTTFRKSY